MDYEFLEALESYTGMSFASIDPYEQEARDAVNTLLAMESEIDYEPAIEGNTTDAIAEYRALGAEVRKHKATIRESLKANNYSAAAEAARTIAAKARELDAKIKNMPYDIKGTVLVFVATTVITAFIAGMTAFVLGDKQHYTHRMKKAVNERMNVIDAGGRYVPKSGPVLSGDDARTRLHKDARNAQTIDVVSDVAGVFGMSGIVSAVKLASKAQKNPDDFTDNDRNLLIASIRAGAKAIAKKYDELAAKYSSMKDTSATESWLFS